MADNSVESQQPTRVDFVALKPGQSVGRYEILAVLGQGGFGITYRARDAQLGREVAIKEYLPTSLAVRQNGTTVLPRSTDVAADFTWGRDRFVAEGRVMATLHRAPGIVRVFDFLEINGTAYIVMEMLHGDTIDQHLRKNGPMDAPAIDRVLWPLLDGLEQVHAAGFLHRDIKPANILLDSDGNPTLIDFGASRAAMAGRSAAMTAIFTPGYAAAEQMTSAKQGPWTDIYGLSATLYHAITGATPPSAFDRMLDDEYQPLGRLAPAGFSSGVLVGIDSGLAIRAGERPQSIAGWRLLLTQTGAGAGDATAVLARPGAPATVQLPTSRPTVQPPAPPTITPPAAAPPVPASAKSRTGLYAAVAAVVLLIGAGGAYFALAPKGPTSVAVQDMKVEELEKVLEARRKADADAAEKRRVEDEARAKVAAEAESRRAADAELEKIRKERQELEKLKAQLEEQKKAADSQRQAQIVEEQRKAELAALENARAELEAQRKADLEARQQAEAEAALARAQAERAKADAEAKERQAAETKQKAEADARTRAEAEARAKADAEVRQKAEAEAKQKADAEAKEKQAAEAKLKAEAEAERKTAEAAEATLRLGVPERQRIQVALTSQGFDTRGSDGALGTRSREMIAAWQKARNQTPATGFLTGNQHQALLREAAAALQKYDDEQKKTEEAKKKAEEEAKKKAEEDAKKKLEDEAKQKAVAAASPAPAPSPAASAPGTPAPSGAAGPIANGPYSGGLNVNYRGYNDIMQVALTMTNGTGSGTVTHPRCGTMPISLKVDPSGTVTGDVRFAVTADCGNDGGKLTGRVEGTRMVLTTASTTTSARGQLTLSPGVSAPVAVVPMATPAAPAPPPAAPTPAAPAAAPGPGAPFDGSYRGTYQHTRGNMSAGNTTIRPIELRVANGSGTGTMLSPGCGTAPISITVSPAGDVTGSTQMFGGNCDRSTLEVKGRAEGGQIRLTFSGINGLGAATMTRQ